jgi:hypothetical protein
MVLAAHHHQRVDHLRIGRPRRRRREVLTGQSTAAVLNGPLFKIVVAIVAVVVAIVMLMVFAVKASNDASFGNLEQVTWKLATPDGYSSATRCGSGTTTPSPRPAGSPAR